MTTPPAPAERLATLLHWLGKTVIARCAGGVLSHAVIGLILGRLRSVRERFADFAARIQAGTYKPPRFAPRQKTPGRPPPVDPLPNSFGWLLKLVPNTAVYNAQLCSLLSDPETVALLAAAPDSLRRPLRSLCRMLAVQPPPILARARPPAPAPKPESPSSLVQKRRGGKSRPVPDRPATPPVRGKPSRPPAPPARKTG